MSQHHPHQHPSSLEARPDPSTRDRTSTINRILDEIDELTQPRWIAEFEDADGNGLAIGVHRHVLPSLLEALRAAVEPGGDNGQAAGGKAFESRPAARLSPIVVLRNLDVFARGWCREFDVRRATTVGHLVAIKGQLGGCTDATLRRLDIELGALYAAARVATGYDDPPAAVRGERCPFCGHESLMWNRQETEFRAWCSNAVCRAAGEQQGMPRTWDNDTLPVLREMLRLNREHETLGAP